MKINLGCGKIHKNGYVNVDWIEPADEVYDVTEGMPYDDGSVDLIEADNLFEHFDNDEFKEVMNECWRVLKQGGYLWIKSPDALNWFEGAFADPTHKRFFVWPRSFYYVQGGHPTYENYGKEYGFKPWKVKGGTNGKFIEVTLTK